MSAPLVSVLIPCYNAEPFVGEAIQSALDQQYRALEVIVVDDGSTDRSLEIIRRFGSHPNVRWEAGPNRGSNAARNRLLSLARGEFVQFLDADDQLFSDKVASQIAEFEAGVDAVFCDYVERVGTTASERTVDYPPASGDLFAYYVRHAVITMLPLHRRACLVEVGGFDERLTCCQEYDLHLRLAARVWRKVKHVRRPLCRHRRLSSSISANEARVFATKAELLTAWHQELAAQEQLRSERSEALAVELYRCGRHLVRHGLNQQAKSAFGLARKLSPDAEFPLRGPMRLLTRIMGPVLAERCRTVLKRCCRTGI